MVVFGGYAAAQLQAVFDLRRDLACCKFAVGLQHRFPFNSSVHRDHALVLELRVPLFLLITLHRPRGLQTGHRSRGC